MKINDREKWKVLIVDDEPQVHTVTKMVLGDYSFGGKKLEFISAYSLSTAKEEFLSNSDTAIILLDVIMEEQTSGLQFVQFVRNEIRNESVRIILRTGQAAQIPEDQVVIDYDINDFKSKTELTYQKLFTSITSALRSYITIENLKYSAHDLEKEKELLAATLHSINDGVIAVNTNHAIIMMNDVSEEYTGFGLTDAYGINVDEVMKFYSRKDHLPVLSPLGETIEKRKATASSDPVLMTSRDGIKRFISYTSSPIINSSNKLLGAVIVIHDETKRIHLEEEIIKIQKLESIGILAGGIAHDFNNILMGILGKISLAKIELNSENRAITLISEAEHAILRAQSLTQQLLTFSKGNAPLKEPVKVDEIIRDAVTISLSGKNVKAELSIDKNISNLFADRGQISQVIENLVINGAQAMPSGGTLRIKAYNCELVKNAIAKVQPGKYVRIDVSDTGVGISHEIIQKIFDPFFTTRNTGNGLGLTTSFTIARQHGGSLTVQSQQGNGSTFSVFLPAYDKPVEERKPSKEITKGNQKSILLMDDDEIILSTVAEILDYLGYNSESAKNGEEAIRLYSQRMNLKKPFDLVIMDLTIPGGMGGREAVQKLKAIDPKALVIVSSGYSNDPVMSDYKGYGFDGLISKPYRIEDLSEVLKKVLVS